MEEGGLVPPHSVLAPGTALGLLRQQGPTLRPGQGYCRRPERAVELDKPERRMREQASARLFDRGCPWATRDPSRWGQLESDRGCGAGRVITEPGRTTLCMEWPLRRGIRTRQICVCRTGRATHDNMSCTSRRNDLGAIAMKRTIATSRSDDNPTNPIKN